MALGRSLELFLTIVLILVKFMSVCLTMVPNIEPYAVSLWFPILSPMEIVVRQGDDMHQFGKEFFLKNSPKVNLCTWFLLKTK